MDKRGDSDPKNLKGKVKGLILLSLSVLIITLGLYLYFYWLREGGFPWQDWFDKGKDYRAVTDVVATSEADNMVGVLVDNVEGISTEEGEDFSSLPYGDLVYAYGDDGEIISGSFTLKGMYEGYNVKNKEIIIRLSDSEDILAFGNDDVNKMYFFPKDITIDLEITNAGLALKPGTTFPLTEEGKEVYKIEDTKNVPEGVDVLVYGDVDYAEGSKITYDVIEFYDL